MQFHGIDSNFEQPVFKSGGAHGVLTFAFRHYNASPETPLSKYFPRTLTDNTEEVLGMENLTVGEVCGGVMAHLCQLIYTYKLFLTARYCKRYTPVQEKIERHFKDVEVRKRDNSIVIEKQEYFKKVKSSPSLTKEFINSCRDISNNAEIKPLIENDDLRIILVARYFGEKQNMKALADSFGCSYESIRQKNKPLKEKMKEIEDRAFS